MARDNRDRQMLPPKEGRFIAYKKAMKYLKDGRLCGGRVIVKLSVPARAKRVCAVETNDANTKCKIRVSEARVLGIYERVDKKLGRARSIHDNSFYYYVGKTVKPKNGFSEDKTLVCGSGIHCYMLEQSARDH